MPKNGVGEIGETRITPYITRSPRPSARRRRGPPGAPARVVEDIDMVSFLLDQIANLTLPVEWLPCATSICRPATDNNDEWRKDSLAAVMNLRARYVRSARSVRKSGLCKK